MTQGALKADGAKRSALSRLGGFAAMLFAVTSWGFGFVATKGMLAGTGPLWSLSLRLLGAVAALLLPSLLIPRWRRCVTAAQIRLSLPAGLLLGWMLMLQTAGLATTSVANSAFITSLYVVFVPLLMAALGRQRLTLGHGLWVLLALLGTALMCNLQHVVLMRGDVFTLLAAGGAAVHIVYLDRVASRITNPLLFNVLQSLWGGLLAAGCATVLEPWHFNPPSLGSWLGSWLFLALICSLVAFTYQIKAQQVLPANVASVLFLLESPVGAVAAWVLIGEELSLGQGLGGGLILAAALAVSLTNRSVETK